MRRSTGVRSPSGCSGAAPAVSLRGLLLDTRPLRESPPFRAWWLGSALSSFGSQLTSFALLYYLWTSTHRPALVGGVALVQLVATVLGALLGGSLADRTDRRLLVMWTRVGQLVGSVALAVLVLTDTASVPAVYAVAAVQTGFGALGAPGQPCVHGPPARTGPARRRARPLAPRRPGLPARRPGRRGAGHGDRRCRGLLPPRRGDLPLRVVRRRATADDAARGRHLTSRRAGPGRRARRPSGWFRGSPVLLGAFATDIAATVLAMPLALFPVINDQVYGGSPVTLGLFAPAIGLGGILAGALSGRVTSSPRQGRLMLASAAIWALEPSPRFGMSGSPARFGAGLPRGRGCRRHGHRRLTHEHRPARRTGLAAGTRERPGLPGRRLRPPARQRSRRSRRVLHVRGDERGARRARVVRGGGGGRRAHTVVEELPPAGTVNVEASSAVESPPTQTSKVLASLTQSRTPAFQ